MKMHIYHHSLIFLVALTLSCSSRQTADLILLNGKILTVDRDFTIAEAVAVSGDKIIGVGTVTDISGYSGRKTKTIDLRGKTVIPGIIDAHMNFQMAALSELGQDIPDAGSIPVLLDWIEEQTRVKDEGEWIVLPRFFATRLIELRQPHLSELDKAAPFHPVFLNGTFGGMINTAAMRLSEITGKTGHPGITTDENTGMPTGFIKASAFELLDLPPEKELSYHDKLQAFAEMMNRYNRFGITSLFAGSGSYEDYHLYRDMAERKMLTTRITQNINFRPDGEITKESLTEKLRSFNDVSGHGDEWVRIGSLKAFLDGGILTGTAYLGEPWGEKAAEFFGFEDPLYRGIVNYTHEELVMIVDAALDKGWTFSAHSTGGGGVELLLDVFEEVSRLHPVNEKRLSIIYGNFYRKSAIERMKNLGIYANMQPAWFYKDADAMTDILGKERVLDFHPYRSLIDAGVVVNGGSDHMVKWDANRSINPYNPFIGMWTAITRTTERGTIINLPEAITREEALRMYTINNVKASFEESCKGSIEPGKLADMVILSDDFLSCPADNIREIESVMTIVGGKIVYESGF